MNQNVQGWLDQKNIQTCAKQENDRSHVDTLVNPLISVGHYSVPTDNKTLTVLNKRCHVNGL